MMLDVLGFEEVATHRNNKGEVEHCEMAWGPTIVMPAPRKADSAWTPGPSALFLTVADPDELHGRVVAAGLNVTMPLTDQEYGSRDFGFTDTSDNVWIFGTYQAGKHE